MKAWVVQDIVQDIVVLSREAVFFQWSETTFHNYEEIIKHRLFFCRQIAIVINRRSSSHQ